MAYCCVCKDCHVLTFTSAGTVADHLVLHPALETGNFIIKVIIDIHHSAPAVRKLTFCGNSLR